MKRIRRVRIEARSSLPTSAACVVANGVRETLTSLLGVPVTIRLCEPLIPPSETWPVIVGEAILYRVRGSVADAVVVLRPLDANALAAAIFGEPARAGSAKRELSPLERLVIDRVVGAIAIHLGVVCGDRETRAVERIPAVDGLVTYFELILEEPVGASIGVALSRDPVPEPRSCMDFAHLASVRLMVSGAIELGAYDARAVAVLAPGATLGISQETFHRGALTTYGKRLGRGRCGVWNGRYALRLDSLHLGAHR